MSGKVSEELLYDTLKKLSSYGQYAEIFIESSKKQAAVFENKILDRVENAVDSGLALRVIDGDKTFFAYTNNFSEKSISETSEELTSALKAGYEKDIAVTSRDSVKLYLAPSEKDIADKIQIVSDMDKASRCDSRIIQSTSVYSEQLKDTRVINTDGSDISQSLCYVTGYTAAVASDGKDMQQGYIPLGGLYGEPEVQSLDFISVSEESARLALKNLSARHAPAGMMTVVLGSSAGGTMVHEAVGHGLEADLACNGMSVYAGKLGQKVAADIITVVDDGTLEHKRGSFIYDDEGVKSGTNILIDKGVLKSYMTDRLYSAKENICLTGNGRRQSYKHRPIVRMTNTMIMPGSETPEDIIKSVDKGLYVARMGGGQVNTVTGDFVFEVTEGYTIVNGKLCDPVKNATLIGNGPKVMREIDMLGSDIGFGIGTCGKEGQEVPVSDAQPTLRIPKITVGGR
ncbi:TldD/PmbA family protein [Deferribacteres bacterium DY0037]|nr:TldD/PmbA family protein [Denitrovibrio acetiphilus]